MKKMKLKNKKLYKEFIIELLLLYSKHCEKNKEVNKNKTFIKNFLEKEPISIFECFEEIEKIDKAYDKKGNAKHYNNSLVDTMTKFERTYGTKALMFFCQITADKYRERIGKKNNQSLEQEVLKMNWYEEKAIFYNKKLDTSDSININIF